ncbi:MAG: hypothetical protein U5K69_16030 [Balneolaceae bacterium]|nr:hypothetical protein [Balneolaceae bacterium]
MCAADVLYGYPKGLITYPFSSINVPGWFAEGVAQYQRSGWTFDAWDSHRDMLLRTAVLNDTYLGFEEMGTFTSKTSLEREQVYNQGFAFSIFLARQFGENIFKEITEALSQSAISNIDEAIKQATGQSGQQLFDEWISDRRKFYNHAVSSINPEGKKYIEDEGFFNFYPTYSPDGSKVAYLSNKQITESAVSLYIADTTTTNTQLTSLELGSLYPDPETSFSCGFSDQPIINRIRSAFSFSPGGDRLIFTRTNLNKLGERYNDLFLYYFESDETTQLTNSARLYDPAWGPGGERIAALQVEQGTTNIVLVDPTNGTVKKVTDFSSGEQLFTPEWHPDGEQIYFSFGEKNGRSIRRVSIDSGEIQTVLAGELLDYRDPFIDAKGRYLYYSADKDGIFNIYRTELEHPAQQQQLTSVRGGAFMPNLHEKGKLLYSEYGKGGYKIVSKPLPEYPNSIVWGAYDPPAPREVSPSSFPDDLISIKSYNDAKIAPLDEATFARAYTGRITVQVPTTGGPDERNLYGYEQKFTDFSFYPVVRFDNYSKFNGSNSELLKVGNMGELGENLLRDLKVGTYFTSREVTDRLNIFGGALFGIGSRDADGIGDFFNPSRLTDLDRDMFLITEYRGFPFIKKRWSPTIALELYNLRRNVDGGLSVEEFPCTSCLPDTTSVDIAYNIWEADLYLRSKINAHSLAEIGIGYTPYRVQTDAFFSRELRQQIPSSSTEYYRGTMVTAAYIYEFFLPYPHSDSAPLGLRSEPAL